MMVPSLYKHVTVRPKTFIILHLPLYNSYFLMDVTLQVEKSFYEAKEDVGMSQHEKEMKKKMYTLRQKVIHDPIPTSLICCFVCYECTIRQQTSS